LWHRPLTEEEFQNKENVNKKMDKEKEKMKGS
jgi:hypothetical protein